jgi:hypothetical protein
LNNDLLPTIWQLVGDAASTNQDTQPDEEREANG